MFQMEKTVDISMQSMRSMALPVMEFQVQGYNIRKIFAQKSTYPKEIIEFLELVYWGGVKNRESF